MEIKDVAYLNYAEAILFHIELMRHWGETRYAVFSRTLVESALARPQQSAVYDNADIFAQAATLCYGLIKNHPWAGGNKRTATTLAQAFLIRNGWRLKATADDLIEMVLVVEAGELEVEAMDAWLRSRVRESAR